MKRQRPQPLRRQRPCRRLRVFDMLFHRWIRRLAQLLRFNPENFLRSEQMHHADWNGLFHTIPLSRASGRRGSPTARNERTSISKVIAARAVALGCLQRSLAPRRKRVAGRSAWPIAALLFVTNARAPSVACRDLPFASDCCRPVAAADAGGRPPTPKGHRGLHDRPPCRIRREAGDSTEMLRSSVIVTPCWHTTKKRLAKPR